MEEYHQILIILFSPLFVIAMFQLSSYANMNIWTPQMNVIEISDFAQLTGLPEKNIRMIHMAEDDVVKFKVMDDNKNVVSEVLLNYITIEILETKNIEIDNNKRLELKKSIFARLTKRDENNIRISEDGNTFDEVEVVNGVETIKGSISFDKEGNSTKAEGSFKNLFL